MAPEFGPGWQQIINVPDLEAAVIIMTAITQTPQCGDRGGLGCDPAQFPGLRLRLEISQGFARRSRLARRIMTAALLALPSMAAACTPHIEEGPGGKTASFRPHTDAFMHCEVAESSYREVISNWLSTRSASAPPLRGLYLGRALTFPWISHHLAEAALRDPQWDARRGKARSGGPNQWVSATLSGPTFLARIATPFAGTPYTPVGISVEKVLVGRAQEVAPELNAGKQLLPFDAQIWLNVDVSR